MTYLVAILVLPSKHENPGVPATPLSNLPASQSPSLSVYGFYSKDCDMGWVGISRCRVLKLLCSIERTVQGNE